MSVNAVIRQSLSILCLLLVFWSVNGHSDTSEKPLSIKEQGSFFVGGKTVMSGSNGGEDVIFPGVGNLSEPGNVVINQMYVQYQIPEHKKSPYPVIMLHGGGHTGKTYESTPDGREGWATYFVRKGFAVYVTDNPTRGRSSYSATQLALVRRGHAKPETLPIIVTPPQHLFNYFIRVGTKSGGFYPNTLFPVEVMDQYFAQLVPSYMVSLQPAIDALLALLDHIGPSIVLVHSQSGDVGYPAAIQRPDVIKALLAIETSRCWAKEEGLDSLVKVPIRIVFGDYVSKSEMFTKALNGCRTLIKKLNEKGGNASLDLLPEAGIKGNSHMMMMDKNNLEIADRLINWMTRNVDGV